MLIPVVSHAQMAIRKNNPQHYLIVEKLQLIFPLCLFTITLKSQLLYHSKFATFHPRVLHTDSGKSWWTSNHHDAMAPFTILSCNTNLFFFEPLQVEKTSFSQKIQFSVHYGTIHPVLKISFLGA